MKLSDIPEKGFVFSESSNDHILKWLDNTGKIYIWNNIDEYWVNIDKYNENTLAQIQLLTFQIFKFSDDIAEKYHEKHLKYLLNNIVQ
jgi:hypothetical protein